MQEVWRIFRYALLALILAGAENASAVDEPCRPLRSSGTDYIVCTLDLRSYEIRLFWKGPDGTALGSLGQLAKTLDGSRLAFAMNAGMYDVDRSPVGLYVENGHQLKSANTAQGPGNFHLKPNGVFYVAGQSAGVVETARFLKQRPRAEFATQSGPMLVIGGRIHPKISDHGTSRKVRNGVGMRDSHTAVFAISNGPVTFSEFAHLFRDELGCADALFLDGSVSSLYAPSLGRTDSLMPLGPMVGALPRR